MVNVLCVNNNNNNKMKNCKHDYLQLFHCDKHANFIITPTFPPQFSYGVVRIEIGNKSKVKIGLKKKKNVSDAKTPMPSLYTKHFVIVITCTY